MFVRRILSLLLLTVPAFATSSTPFPILGLNTPADVADSIFVHAQPPATTVSVAFYLDDQLRTTETQAPFSMGGQLANVPKGFSVNTISPGTHRLRAVATLANKQTVDSTVITLNIHASNNPQFSSTLKAYANQPSAQNRTLAAILADTATPGASLTSTEQAARTAILAMYLNWGIDPSLDSGHDQSATLLALSPTGWTVPVLPAAQTPLSLVFSPDAPFYQPIPASWPRTALPSGYFHTLQLNTTQQGDGLGFGVAIAGPNDAPLIVTSQWYLSLATRKTFPFPMPSTWFLSLPSQLAGDLHMIFVDPRSRTFVSTYKTSLDLLTGGPDALATGSVTSLTTLGDHGGSTAAGFAELPILLQSGEATDATHLIRHALGGSVSRSWAARVYPASAWDTAVKTSINTCTHLGYTNTGLVPYGGVLQLDPTLDLTRIKLTLPALRILQAIQTYGYYVMDFGCADLDIYTSIDETELDPYGGLWGYNRLGPGVQNEVSSVLMNNKLSVVVPLSKKQ